MEVEQLVRALDAGLPTLTKVIDLFAKSRLPHSLLLVSRFLSSDEVLLKLIEKILNDKTCFARMVAESYYHQNGFDKIVLLSGEGFKVRLHHFHAQSQNAPMENIHDHRWPFASTILNGRFDMLMFEETECAGELRKLYTYYSDKSTGQYRTDLVGERKLKCIGKYTMEEGVSYIMLPHELHSIVHLPQSEAITLIVTGNNERETCKLYAKGEIEDEQRFMVPYDSEWLRAKLCGIANRSIKIAC